MGSGLYGRGECECCGQALAEFVVKVPCERAPLLLLDLEQPLRQRPSLRVRPGETFGEIIDRARDQGELRALTRFDRPLIVAAFKPPQPL